MILRSNDYYEILGVERGAEERDVKRAYFRLVRKFSPENHPEDFKRIREAYEVLSNVVSRKDYDGLTQWGDEINLRMKAGQAAMERTDFKTAQTEFKHVLVLHPQLAFARDLLGMAFLNGGQPREAVVQFDLLVSQQPDNSVYHLHKGYAHYAQRQYQQASVAYQRALEIDPADTRVRIALADCYSDTEQFDAALIELDKAIHQDGEVNFQDFVFLMRKVQIQLLRDRPDLADAEINQIFQILPPDGESRKYVATRIGALAAQLFRMRRSADANRMLARARQLDHRKSLEFQFPAKATMPIAALPSPSQTVLAAMKKNWTPTKLSHRALTGPVLLSLVALSAALIGFYGAANSETLWVDGTKGFMLLFFASIPVLGTLAARRLMRVTKSPFGKFTEVHPLYLIQVDIDRLTLWPLVNLHDVALTHRLQNGAYQSTSVRMDFGGVPLHLSIRGQQAAVDWAQNLLDTRHRTLALLTEGLLDSEDGLDLVPPPLLLGVKPTVDLKARKKTLLSYGGALAGGALLFFGGAMPMNQSNAEHAAWSRATGYGASVDSYRGYLKEFPNGRYANSARQAIVASYSAARANFDKPGAPAGGVALGQVIDALRDHNAHEVKLDFKGSTNWNASAFQVADERIAVESAFTDEKFREREKAFTADLQRALAFDTEGEAPGSTAILSVTDAPDSEPPATFRLTYVVEPSFAMEPSRVRTAGLKVDFDFAILIDGAVKYRLSRTVLPNRNLMIEGSLAYTSDADSYRDLIAQAFDAFGASLGEELGVSWPTPASASPGHEYFGRGTEEQRRTREFLQKVIEDQSRHRNGTNDDQ